MTINTKKTIEMDVFTSTGGDCLIKGRCLGLLTAEEYAGLLEHPALMKKLSTVETKPLEELAEVDDVEGLRFVMTMKEQNNEAVTQPTLFVTEPLDLISSIVTVNDLNLNGQEGSYYIVSEKEV